MSIQATNQQVSFNGLTKKTNHGNEYQSTRKGRIAGSSVGLLSGALASHMVFKPLQTVKGKKELLNSFKNMGIENLKYFGKVKERGCIKAGIITIKSAIALGCMLAGGIIGDAFDEHTNKKRARAADEAARANR